MNNTKWNHLNLNPVLVTAWGVILSISLYKIISQEVFLTPVTEENGYRVEMLIVLFGILLSVLVPVLSSLRKFFFLFLFLVGSQWLVYTRVDRLPYYQSWLNSPAFSTSMLAEQSLGLMVSTILIAFLFILKKKPGAFFLRMGNLEAMAEPVRWLDIKSSESWKVVGTRFALFISLGTFIFLVIAGRPTLSSAVLAIRFLPAVLICAALNAFNEEVTYKASFLAMMEDVVGKKQALLLMAAFFGIFHFYGIPYGIIGVAMATFLGWFLGKSMLETRGIFWAWLIHFLQDVLIFLFLAIGSVSPGG